MSGLWPGPRNTGRRQFAPAACDAGADDTALCRHLRGSVDEFGGSASSRQRLRQVGFTGVHSEPCPGWHHSIVHTFLAGRPGVAVPGTGATG